MYNVLEDMQLRCLPVVGAGDAGRAERHSREEHKDRTKQEAMRTTIWVEQPSQDPCASDSASCIMCSRVRNVISRFWAI